MSINFKNKELDSTMNAGDFKVAAERLKDLLDNIPEDHSVTFYSDEENILTNLDELGLIDPFGKFAPPEPGDDLNGDGIPDNIPPHILPFVRQMIRLRAQNAILKARFLDANVQRHNLEQFARHLTLGTLKVR